MRLAPQTPKLVGRDSPLCWRSILKGNSGLCVTLLYLRVVKLFSKHIPLFPCVVAILFQKLDFLLIKKFTSKTLFPSHSVLRPLLRVIYYCQLFFLRITAEYLATYKWDKAQLPLLRFVQICSGFVVQLVVQQIRNKWNEWSSNLSVQHVAIKLRRLPQCILFFTVCERRRFMFAMVF